MLYNVQVSEVSRSLENELGKKEKFRQFQTLCQHEVLLAVSKKRHKTFHTAASSNFPETEKRLGLDLMLILKKWQQLKFVLERNSKAAEAALVRNEARASVRDTSVVMMCAEKYVKSGLPATGGRRVLQWNADFKAGLSATGVTPMKAGADAVGQGKITYLKPEI